jgi:hypothetical protein
VTREDRHQTGHEDVIHRCCRSSLIATSADVQQQCPEVFAVVRDGEDAP